MGSVTFYVDGVPVTVSDRTYSLDSTATPVSPAAFKTWGDTAGDREKLWRSQPAIRMVTTFLAANIAQVPIHGFTRGKDGRVRLDRAHPVEQVLRLPDPRRRQTGFEMMHTLVLDVCKYDRYCGQLFATEEGWQLVRLPPSMWRFVRDTTGAPSYIEGTRPSGSTFVIPLDRALWLDGFPSDDDTSPIASLLGVLAEEELAASYRSDLWANGGRMGGTITRPADAPPWNMKDANGKTGRDKFRASWQEYAAGGTRAGRTPILEDGMTYNEAKPLSPEDGQQLESRKFSLGLVAAAFHMSPQVAAVLEGGSYNSVQAYREALYSDTLGSWFQRVGQAFNVRLVPQLTRDPDVYVEFNVAEKLRLAFEDQARIFQTSTGGPIMTRNEARDRLNLPRIDGADELIVPLNVITGGQASPTDSGSQNQR